MLTGGGKLVTFVLYARPVIAGADLVEHRLPALVTATIGQGEMVLGQDGCTCEMGYQQREGWFSIAKGDPVQAILPQ